MKNRLLFLSTALIATISTPIYAQDNPVNTAQYRAHAEFLADDLLEGREAGTRGYDIAANYVATQFMAMGVAPGDLDGDYMQPIQFAQYWLDEDADNYVMIDGIRYDHGGEVLTSRYARYPEQDDEVELVFVGNGLYAPEFGLDDYKDLDIDGKVAVMLGGRNTGMPDTLPSDVAAHLGSTKGLRAEQLGAIGILTLFPDALLEGFPWKNIIRYNSGKGFDFLDSDGQANQAYPNFRLGAVAVGAPRAALFEGSPLSWDDIEAKLKAKEAIPTFALDKKIRIARKVMVEPTIVSANVIGMVEGSDPELKDEVILLTAHLDHIGIEKEAKPGEDNINNGLFDNALGVSAILEVARLLASAETAPRRTVAFVALTAEEKGLVGSEWLAANLDQFGDKKLVGTINLDMPIIPADFDRVIAYGAEHSTMGDYVTDALANFSVTRIDDPMPEEVFFVRSDHYSFVKQGIPSINLDPYVVEEAQPLAQKFLKERYHQVGDQIGQPIDWNAAAKFAYVNYLITLRAANNDTEPRWYADSYFGNAMAPDAEKVER